MLKLPFHTTNLPSKPSIMNFFKKNNSGLGVFSSFKVTPDSERLHKTFEEVQTFKRQLIKADAALHAFGKATAEVLRVTDDSMASFPRAWRKANAAGASAAVPQEDTAKTAPTAKKLSAYPSEAHVVHMEAALEEEVYVPIERWHKQYQHIKSRVAGVEAARAEYDVARKDVAAKRQREVKHARKTDGRTDAQLEADEAAAEAIMNAKRDAYIEIEEAVHVQLLALTADAQGCLGHVTRALQLNSRALMSAADDVAEKEAEMPKIETQSSGPLALGVVVESASPTGAVHPHNPTGHRPDFTAALAEQQQAAAVPEQAGDLPAAPTHKFAVEDSASEFPAAPVHSAETAKPAEPERVPAS